MIYRNHILTMGSKTNPEYVKYFKFFQITVNPTTGSYSGTTQVNFGDKLYSAPHRLAISYMSSDITGLRNEQALGYINPLEHPGILSQITVSWTNEAGELVNEVFSPRTDDDWNGRRIEVTPVGIASGSPVTVDLEFVEKGHTFKITSNGTAVRNLTVGETYRFTASVNYGDLPASFIKQYTYLCIGMRNLDSNQLMNYLVLNPRHTSSVGPQTGAGGSTWHTEVFPFLNYSGPSNPTNTIKWPTESAQERGKLPEYYYGAPGSFSNVSITIPYNFIDYPRVRPFDESSGPIHVRFELFLVQSDEPEPLLPNFNNYYSVIRNPQKSSVVYWADCGVYHISLPEDTAPIISNIEIEHTNRDEVESKISDYINNPDYDASLDYVYNPISKIRIAVPYNTRYGAYVKTVKINGVDITDTDAMGGILVESNMSPIDGIWYYYVSYDSSTDNIPSTFVFSITDSRGATTTSSVDIDVRNYIQITLRAEAFRPVPTDGSAAVKITGSFDKRFSPLVAQTLKIQYASKLESDAAYGLYRILDRSGYDVNANGTITTNPDGIPIVGSDDNPNAFDYANNYNITFITSGNIDNTGKYRDIVISNPSTPNYFITLLKGIPVFDWDDKDFRFNVPVSAPSLSLDSDLSIGGASFVDLINTINTLTNTINTIKSKLPVLLWENNGITSWQPSNGSWDAQRFPEQQDFQDYDALLVRYLSGTSGLNGTVLVLKDSGAYSMSIMKKSGANGQTIFAESRDISYKNGVLGIARGFRHRFYEGSTNPLSSAEDGTVCIPYQIYGVNMNISF